MGILRGRWVGEADAISDSAPEVAAVQPSERDRIVALVADVARTLAAADGVHATLQACAEALVRHLDAAFARVWTYNESDEMLELQASAGMYTHLNGTHGRVPLGAYKIGLIAHERLPHLTNSVVGDPRVSEQAWAIREGLVAFAGYPLLVGDRLVGVTGLFARQPLSDDVLFALASVADSIALGVERLRAQEALTASLERESAARQVAEDAQARATQLAIELARAQTYKDEFLSAAAHDLKNPLTGIQGLAQLLMRRLQRPGEVNRDDMRRGLEQITDASRRMTLLINEVMDLTRLESGEPLDLNREVTNLYQLIERRVAEYAALAEDHTIEISYDGTEVVGLWDRDRIDRVVGNLLGNAVKYSPGDGRVTVSVGSVQHQDSRWAVLSVQDEGIGVPKDELPNLFTRFYRASNVPGSISGTGIGLAAVRQIVEQHGGDIVVASEVGQGSTFTVRLPFEADQSSADLGVDPEL